MLNKKKIRKIKQINDYYLKCVNGWQYLLLSQLSEQDIRDYKTALKKNNITDREAQIIRVLQYGAGLFKDWREFNKDYELYGIMAMNKEL